MPTPHPTPQEALNQELKKEDEKARQEFKLVPKETEKISLLSECAKLQTVGMLWTQNQDLVFQTQCAQLNSPAFEFTVLKPKDMQPTQMDDLLKNPLEFFFNLAHPAARLFFKSKLKTLTATHLIFEVPEKLFRVQRRNSFRLSVGGFYGLEVSFQHPSNPNQTLKKKVFDLSDLGLAFLIDTTEEALFKKGTQLKRLTFTLNKQAVALEGEVRHTQPLGDENKELSKVGIQFSAMKQDAAKLIASFVLTENRKFISSAIK